MALAGVALVGLLAGEAQAKWIKATVTGTVTGSAGGYTLQNGSTFPLNFYIQNYAGSTGTPNTWVQTTALPNYTQLFNYATGTGSTGISGNYNASLAPSTDSSIIQANDNGSNFLLRVAASPSTGLTIDGTNTPIAYISLGGGLNNFASSFPANADVVDFISTALGGTSKSFGCTTSCSGVIQPTNAETPITFSWTSIQFDQIEPVPAPLPLAGALAAFSFSRKLRTRLASS